MQKHEDPKGYGAAAIAFFARQGITFGGLHEL